VQFTKALREDEAFNGIVSSLGLEMDAKGAGKLQVGDSVGAFLAALEYEAEKKEKKKDQDEKE
jgi:hypothetical protein